MVSKLEPVRQLINQLPRKDRMQLCSELKVSASAQPGDGPDRDLSFSAAAKLLSVSPKTVRRYCQTGVLHGYRLGGGDSRVVRLKQSEVCAAMAPTAVGGSDRPN